MIYTDYTGKIINTAKDEVIYISCGEVISKEDIDSGHIYTEGDRDNETGIEWKQIACQKCADEAEDKAIEAKIARRTSR